MTPTTDRIDHATEIEDIREQLRELQERFHGVMQDVRWLAEVAAFLEGEEEPAAG
jgi:archaellum component FlaC